MEYILRNDLAVLRLDDALCAEWEKQFGTTIRDSDFAFYSGVYIRSYFNQTLQQAVKEHTPEELSEAVMCGMRQELHAAPRTQEDIER